MKSQHLILGTHLLVLLSNLFGVMAHVCIRVACVSVIMLTPCRSKTFSPVHLCIGLVALNSNPIHIMNFEGKRHNCDIQYV